MKWKICLIACINIFFVTFPYNIIGCGPETDPYDYYTSFFLKDLSAAKNYHPFLYSNLLFLYDTNEPVDAAHATSAEWIAYCGNSATHKEAYDFVCRFKSEEITALYKNLAEGVHNYLADSVKRNSITKYFQQYKNPEALRYLVYAKKVEPYINIVWNDWDAKRPDSLQLDALLKEGKQLYGNTKKDFIKLRYAYQITRLALYSRDNKNCIRYYDEMISADKSQSILHDLAASLKAGALFRTGKNYEAAILFSRQFSRSPVKRVSNYLGFSWYIKRLDETDRTKCLAMCKTNEDKANLLGLFALGSPNNEEATLKKIYALSSNAEMLEVLAVREINKIEENYFSVALDKQKGGNKLFFNWYDDSKADNNPWLQEAKSLINFYHQVAQSSATHNKPMYETGAAYLCYITKNYGTGKLYLQNVVRGNASQKIKDQTALTSLLITVNEQQVIDSTFETKLLPSIKWLYGKALEEKKNSKNLSYYDDGWQETQWENFYRNLFAEILAKRYHAQKNICKEALCIGNGEGITGLNYATEEFVENNMQTKDVIALYKLQRASRRTEWDAFICNNFPLQKDKVKEVVAVSHIRDYHFTLALHWLSGIRNKELIKLDRNPFADILIDIQDSTFYFDEGNFNKIVFLKEMERLTKKEKENKATTADFYKLATGYYNMTYYGRAWNLVKYFRAGEDGYFVPPNALPFEREYYGCFTAEKYYKKALNAFPDKNTQARCLFMMAKCAQKRVARKPEYDFGFNDNSKDFLSFKYSNYFPRLVKDYADTKFFEEAYNTCSYLKDFVGRK